MNKQDIPISASIIAQNEEKYIEKAIKNLLPNVAEVLVVDGGSKDDTIRISKESGAKVNVHSFEFDFAAQRNYAMNRCEKEWILFCDADEKFSDEFFSILPSLVLQTPENCKGYHVYRISIFDGEERGRDFQWRLLHKRGGFWKGKVHEGFTFYKSYHGLKLPQEYLMYHEHTMKRQLYNNALYYNINKGIKKRPKSTEGMEYQKNKWIKVPTERDT